MAKLPQDYDSVMARKQEVMKAAIGIDYSRFESGSMAFDYERMMRETGYSLEEMQKIQRSVNVGDTPILELKNLTALARACAPEGKGARIFIKDEAANPSGSFKARRAANAVYHAKKLGYKGVIAATSGNYGAAVASQAAIAGLECIIVQECYDSNGVGQPEIIEKARRQGYQIAVDSGAYCDFACPVGSEVFCEGWQQIYDCSYEDILAGTGKYAGQRLTEETFHELRETDPDASVTAFVGKPYEIALALKQPYVMISTDGGFPNLAPGIGHPQTAGTYPKILRELVREQDVLTVMDFVKKSSWMPAQFFGLETKGFIGEGADADILVFDLKRVKDNATFPGMGDPMAQPDGIDYVLVGGVPVVDNGIIQKDAKPGKSIFSRTEIWQM